MVTVTPGVGVEDVVGAEPDIDTAVASSAGQP
jgi:hypothetical protein